MYSLRASLVYGGLKGAAPSDSYITSVKRSFSTSVIGAEALFEMNFLKFNTTAVSYTHLRAHETVLDLVCCLLLEKKNSPLLNSLLPFSHDPPRFSRTLSPHNSDTAFT